MSGIHGLSVEWVSWGTQQGDAPSLQCIALGFGPHKVSLLPEEAWAWADSFIRYAWAALVGQARPGKLYRSVQGEEFTLHLIPTETSVDWLQDVEIRVEDASIPLSAKDLELYGFEIQSAVSEAISPTLAADEIIALAEDYLRQEPA